MGNIIGEIRSDYIKSYCEGAHMEFTPLLSDDYVMGWNAALKALMSCFCGSEVEEDV